MDALGPFHPQIVHMPVALLVVSAVLAVAGRLYDREWVRRAAMLLLVFGFLGAWLAVQSGGPAHRVPEREQGVPEAAIDAHAQPGRLTMWTAGVALVAHAAAVKLPAGAAGAARALALVLQLAAALLVAVSGARGGKLVYEYGANVRVGGVLVKNPGAGDGETAAKPAGEAGREAPAAEVTTGAPPQ